MVRGNEARIQDVADILRTLDPPPPIEATPRELGVGLLFSANAYLAIVAICHQTSPVGEAVLRGTVGGRPLLGWDFLKERWLEASISDPGLNTHERWLTMSATDLSNLYATDGTPSTLSRLAERALLLNDLGRFMTVGGWHSISESFEQCGFRWDGNGGMLEILAGAIAYSDPVMKKSLFFASIATSDCGWRLTESLAPPVDYHEVRGHLRLGTVQVEDEALKRKLLLGLTLSEDEDTVLRCTVSNAIQRISELSGHSAAVLHYYFWNIFRSCCPRPSVATHCFSCPTSCQCPEAYQQARPVPHVCPFSTSCESAGQNVKMVDPAYAGHFY
ncbi:MAG: hypothetical protein EON58_06420 [Alphaproteobacteria bacterium]|nr:MAG: hypothetical protein EON58_06420 [Alphaproteobacteria bacterium]